MLRGNCKGVLLQLLFSPQMLPFTGNSFWGEHVVKTLECSAEQLDINSTKIFAPLSLSQQVLTNAVKKGEEGTYVLAVLIFC